MHTPSSAHKGLFGHLALGEPAWIDQIGSDASGSTQASAMNTVN